MVADTLGKIIRHWPDESLIVLLGQIHAEIARRTHNAEIERREKACSKNPHKKKKDENRGRD